MKTILEMLLLGIVAGMISVFWCRIIGEDMLLSFVERWLMNKSFRRTLDSGRGEIHPLQKFLTCMYCITPWIVFLLSIIYIIAFHPVWYLALIGVFGALGSGNFICEIIHSIRRS